MVEEISVFKRDVKKESPETLKKKGMIPAVFYGKKQESTPIYLDFTAFLKVWKKAGESSVVTLNVGKDKFDCLIYDVDIDPIKNVPRHVDFYVFEKGQKLKVKVPIEFIGVAPAVKDLGGVLVKVMHDIEVEASPKDLPQKIEVDISLLLNIDSQILLGSLKLPENVSLATTKKDEVVASVYMPKEEVIEVAPVAPDLSAIEVEKKGKKEEEVIEEAEPKK